jgi:tetratricopeptide (TPR) repeat protein
VAIRGSLREASLPDVLQLLSMGKKTGCLSVSHRNSFGSIYFDKGRITYASIVNRRDRLGDMLLKTGMITPQQLEDGIAAQSRQRDKRLGEILIDQGVITADQLRQSIRVQIEEAVYFLFTWTQGTFNFESELLPESQDMRVSINPESLLLEGARRVDEWGLIEKKIPSFDVVFEVDRARFMATDATLTTEQRAVVELVDGLRDVQGIVDQSGLVEFEVGKALYGLVSAGFIQRIGTSARAAPRPSTDDARIEEHRNLGVAFFKADMSDEAEREFRRVLELRPTDGGAHAYMGLLFARRGEWNEAATAFEESGRPVEARYRAYHNLAIALDRQGRVGEARAALDEALRRGGAEDPRVLTTLAVQRLWSGDLRGAAEALDAARARVMGTPAASWFHYAGLVAAVRGELATAADILGEGVRAHPRAGLLANNLAAVRERQGQLDAARDAVERGLLETPALPQLHKNLGDLHYRAGRFDEAYEAFARARDLDPSLGDDLYLKLGNLHLRRAERDEAVRCWERAAALDPDNAIVRANLRSISVSP